MPRSSPFADQGTFVQPHQAALIFDPDEGWSISGPYYADEKQMPSEICLMAAIMLREGPGLPSRDARPAVGRVTAPP